MSRTPHPVSRGFTLVELLVVIGIAALLISILLPALNRARQQAQLVACQSNIRQWGLAMQMYAANNRQCLPGANQEEISVDLDGDGKKEKVQLKQQGAWYIMLMHYLYPKQLPIGIGQYTTVSTPPLYTCPAEGLNIVGTIMAGQPGLYLPEQGIGSGNNAGWRRDGLCYGGNMRPFRDLKGGTWDHQQFRVSDFSKAHQQLAMFDVIPWASGRSNKLVGLAGIKGNSSFTNPPPAWTLRTFIARRHVKDLVPCLFLDGHVEALPWSVVTDPTDPLQMWKHPEDLPPKFVDSNDY